MPDNCFDDDDADILAQAITAHQALKAQEHVQIISQITQSRTFRK
jgi:hypothetical protein